jgi:ABC-type dipeptide/oligopeptide/nickel transport system ATPase component
MTDTAIRPFHIDVPQADLDDLTERLARTRWANELPLDTGGPQMGPVPPGWEYGVPVGYVKDLVEHWQRNYDWRQWEARLNAYPQFTTMIDGQNIHFVHARSPEPDAFPLILTHGWPNTFLEYLEMVAPLSDPRAHGAEAADAFHVVVPSLPGFAFSGPTTEPGWDAQRTRRRVDELIELVGLGDRRTVRGANLSGGQKRRLDVALGVVGNPELIFLDEPTTGLDPVARRQAWGLVQRLTGLGKTVLLTTHYLDEAEALADRVGVIVNGRLVEVASPRELGGRAHASARVSFKVEGDLAGRPGMARRGLGGVRAPGH